MLTRRVMKTTGVVALTLIAVAACRPEEQGRVIRYEPGVIQKPIPSEAISEASLAEMRQRAVLQGGITIGLPTAGGGPNTGGNVRPPDSDEFRALRERGKHQGGN